MKKDKIKEWQEELGKKKIGQNQLTTSDELEIMGQMLGLDIAVFSKNLLDKIIIFKNSKTGNYIVNLQNSDEGSGTHWVALKVYPHEAFYYDSFGIFPPKEIINFLTKNEKKQNIRDLYVNNKHIQNIGGGYCGQYCVDFLRFMSQEKQNLSDLDRFNKYLELWYSRE